MRRKAILTTKLNEGVEFHEITKDVEARPPAADGNGRSGTSRIGGRDAAA
jgi:hypothetical protein